MGMDMATLPRSWKRRYPFRTGTTSFIYPADYTANVALLGPFVDEIELLMFESAPASRPAPQLVEDLRLLGRKHDVRYNIHLPTDLDLTHPDRSIQEQACGVMRDFIARLAPLDPTVYVLHLHPPKGIGQVTKDLVAWQRIAAGAIGQILPTGLPGSRLALENLFFPYEWLAPLLSEYDLGVCLDTGHLGLRGDDLAAFLETYDNRIVIAHLHGLANGQDHQALTNLPPGDTSLLADWLDQFTGTVSLEVFGLEPLVASLFFLDQMMAGHQTST
jgi:sugar phosphate isomerase/epimerase